MGRRPTYQEYKDAYEFGAHVLIDRLLDEGIDKNDFDVSIFSFRNFCS